MPLRPLVSIITVVFNGAKTLEQTISSVINQTYKNIEYIIIDGGSTDGTLDIIKKYENRITYWISESDRGLYDAMNKGIKLANGELIGIINSDDWFDIDAIETIVKAYNSNPTKRIFHGDRRDILEDGATKIKKFNPSKYKLIYYGMTYNHPSMFVHKEIYKSCMYNPNLKALSDYEFILKHYLSSPQFFSYIPHAYVNYRLNGISGNMLFWDAIKEGYLARKNAGLNIIQNIFSAAVRTFRVLVNKLISF